MVRLWIKATALMSGALLLSACAAEQPRRPARATHTPAASPARTPQGSPTPTPTPEEEPTRLPRLEEGELEDLPPPGATPATASLPKVPSEPVPPGTAVEVESLLPRITPQTPPN